MTDVLPRREARDNRRFAFGQNWRRFLSVLDEERIATAQRSLDEMIGRSRLEGRTFLDVGCGSGLFSLAAMRIGARRVHSFDYDDDAVACARTLKDRFYPASDSWTIEQGSALDKPYLARLGTWDVVYSWGVLHHTGDMWPALENVSRAVAPDGVLFISLYNDQGIRSVLWKRVKILFNSGVLGRATVIGVFFPYFALRGLAGDLARARNPLARYREYRRVRGMSAVHDWLDWLGGYPFEVATPGDVLDFGVSRGFSAIKLRTCGGGLGCNEFVFREDSRATRVS